MNAGGGGFMFLYAFMIYTLCIYIYMYILLSDDIYIFVHSQVRVSRRQRTCWNVHGGLYMHIYICIYQYFPLK